MRPYSARFLFWWRWLLAATLIVIVVGFCFVLLPAFTRHAFGLLFFGSGSALDEWPAAAVGYVNFAHGLLGALMIGWGVSLAFVALGPLRAGHAQAWRTFAVSLSIWFVVDSGLSLWTGFWQNVVLNTVFVLLFLPALAGLRRFCTDG